jgi:hypothetical protein
MTKDIPIIEGGSLEGRALRVREIINFRDYLSPTAQKIYDSKMTDTVIKKDGNWYPFVSFSKVVTTPYNLESPLVRKAPEWAIIKMANTISRLVESKLIGHGVLAPAVEMDLADGNFTSRILLVLYTYSLEHSAYPENIIKKLNDFLGNEAFAPEGQIGSDDWSTL